MKGQTLIAATSLFIFSGSVLAASDAEIYHGFADGNPDLSTGIEQSSVPLAVQPGVGDSVDSYRFWSSGNPDLYSGAGGSRVSNEPLSATDSIYHGFGEGNPDL